MCARCPPGTVTDTSLYPHQKSELALSGPDAMHQHYTGNHQTTLHLYLSNTSLTNENNPERTKLGNYIIFQAFFKKSFYSRECLCHLFQEIVLCFWTGVVFREEDKPHSIWMHTPRASGHKDQRRFLKTIQIGLQTTLRLLYTFLIYIYTYIYIHTHSHLYSQMKGEIATVRVARQCNEKF